jgi:hypothetical protein
MKADDGAIEESEFLRAANEGKDGTKPFSKKEIDSHIKTLCEEGKIMKSGETFYIID